MSTALFVLPRGIDDSALPSGGNRYDRRALDCLAARGWSVTTIELDGNWPSPARDAPARLERALADLPDGSLVLVDGLVTAAVAPALNASAVRHRLVLLLHMIQGGAAEYAVASASRAIVATSRWSARRMAELVPMPRDRLHVAEPGVDPGDITPGSPAGDRLLCVGAIAHHKGQDVLAQALALLVRHRWTCTFVGSAAVEPAFARRVEASLHGSGIGERVTFPGALTGGVLDEAYAAADLLVVPSRTEAYGMVVTEALARGIPVVCSDAGGLPQTLGVDAGGAPPGLLVPAGDARALARSIGTWLEDPNLRTDLRARAVARRPTLHGWDRTTDQIERVLCEVAA